MIKEFLKRKNIIFSAKRYGIDALGAMAQGLFASLLIGTIISTLGKQLGIDILVQIGDFASAVKGPAMAIAIAIALGAPRLVMFMSLKLWLLSPATPVGLTTATAALSRCTPTSLWKSARSTSKSSSTR